MSTCKNVWHKNPGIGGLLACPTCRMSVTEAQTLNETRAAAGMETPRVAPPPASARVRILFKHFEGVEIPKVVDELNKWCAQVSTDDRQRIVNVDMYVFGNQFHAIVAINMLF